jgi:hypothetical protein
MPAFVVKGASHHFWTHPPKQTDAPAVKRARARIARAIDKWLDVVEESSGGGGKDDTQAGAFKSVGGGDGGPVVAR